MAIPGALDSVNQDGHLDEQRADQGEQLQEKRDDAGRHAAGGGALVGVNYLGRRVASGRNVTGAWLSLVSGYLQCLRPLPGRRGRPDWAMYLMVQPTTQHKVP